MKKSLNQEGVRLCMVVTGNLHDLIEIVLGRESEDAYKKALLVSMSFHGQLTLTCLNLCKNAVGYFV